jgi:hypothetical protein
MSGEMNVGAGLIYYFNGNPECDQCSNVTGYYATPPVGEVDDPESLRPHPGCDCTIESQTVVGIFEEIYKNKQEQKVSTYAQVHENVDHYVNNSPYTVPVTLGVSETVTGDISVSAKIDEIFGVSGKYTESRSVSRTIGPVELPPDGAISVSVVGTLTTVEFSADVYWKAITGEEVFISTLSDRIEAVDGVEVVVDGSQDR